MTEKAGPPQNMEYYPPPTNPPPYEPYPPPPQPITSQPFVSQPGLTVVVNPVGSKPSNTTCRSCQAAIITRVQFSPSVRTHLFALILCAVGCWPLVCVPYCVDSCNNADHYCPNCGAFVGSYRS